VHDARQRRGLRPQHQHRVLLGHDDGKAEHVSRLVKLSMQGGARSTSRSSLGTCWRTRPLTPTSQPATSTVLLPCNLVFKVKTPGGPTRMW